MLIKKSKILMLFAFIASSFFLSSCDDDESIAPVKKSIVEIASETNDLSSLVAALSKSSLVSALQGDGPFTVLAPKNTGFQALLDTKPTWNSLEDIPLNVLSDVLKYHVIEGKAMSANLKQGDILTTLNGEKLTVDTTNGVSFTTASGQTISVSNADILASNGVIHLIDEVLLPFEVPLNIVDLAVKTPSLSTLVEAVKKAELVEALAADGSMTVFAPTNDAFKALLTKLNKNSLDDLSAEELKPILLFHVLGKKVKSTDLADGYQQTLSNGPGNNPISLQIETSPNIEFNGNAKPSQTLNVEASNGIIHVINDVMLPPNVVDLALNNSNFSLLVKALTDTRLSTKFVDVLSGDGPFTIFAPTNEAFNALLNSNKGWNSVSDIDKDVLEKVLKYHVINNTNAQASDLTNGQKLTTLQGGELTVDLSNGAKLKTSMNKLINIITTDVQGKNGVIHAIDEVMIPE